MQKISAVSSNVAVRGDSSPCSRGLWLHVVGCSLPCQTLALAVRFFSLLFIAIIY